MKTTRIATLVMAALLLAAMTAAPAKAANVSFDFFYSNLSPHGSWMVSSSYGNVWQPRVYNTDWNPYYDGHWVYTDCGWTWASDYAWGGVPYHYGTWVRDARLGWVWVPGYVWGPSWVVFRSDADYIGWAPVPPSFSVGMSFGAVSVDPSFYVFVPSRSFVSPQVRTVIVPRTETNVIINRTKIVNNNITIQNNVVVNRGPDIRVVERESGRRIEQVPIERVRNAAPSGGTITRDDIRVDEQSVRGRKVAEPVREPIEQARAREGRNTSAQNDQPRGDRQNGDRHGRERQNAETTTVQPQTPQQRPDHVAGVHHRRSPNRPAETSTDPGRTQPQPMTPNPRPPEPRVHRRPVQVNPQTPQEPPRGRPERPLPPQPQPQPPRVKPQEPPLDPNTSNVQQPSSVNPKQKGKPAPKGNRPPEKGHTEKPNNEKSNQTGNEQ